MTPFPAALTRGLRLLAGLSVTGALLGPASPVSGADAQAVFRAGVDFVLVDVSVRLQGEPVTDLTARDFRLYDAGVEQTLEDVSRETLPIDVLFVVDLSGSVDGPLLDSLSRAVAGVETRLRPDDRATIVTFNHRIRELDAVSVEGLAASLALGTPSGQTSLVDAMTVALIRPTQTGRRRMAIVFTDGLDTTSFLDGASLVDVARRAETAVFTVALSPGTERRRVTPPHRQLFETLAQSTGGAYTVLQRNQDLGPSFVQAFDEFRTSYVLRYAYQGPARPGWHPLSVQVTRRGPYDIRARQGYFSAVPATPDVGTPGVGTPGVGTPGAGTPGVSTPTVE
jgi:Ca-activated chloride channel family protein